MEVYSKPEELDALDREILQKEIEIMALKKESDIKSNVRLSNLEKEMINLKEKSNQTSPNKDSNEMESVEDYQLNRAIDLIRSISVYEGLRKAS